MKTALWWVRRDLRLTDNQALAAALAAAERVIPVFVIDRGIPAPLLAGEKRIAFLWGGLRTLDADLRSRGSRLVVRQGDPAEELAGLARESGAEAVYAEEDTWPYARQRDARVANRLPLYLAGGLTVHPSPEVVKGDGSPYTVFTPFSRAWKALPLPAAGSVVAAPERMPAVPDGLSSLSLPAEPSLPASVPFPPGEAEAQHCLRAFIPASLPPTGLSAVYCYAEARHRMGQDGTSRLSPYLRFGMLSARQAAMSALSAMELAPDETARRGVEIWLNELIWREFYLAIQYYFPEREAQSFRAELRQIPWENDKAAFEAWRTGRTGYPVVDAGLRQLVETGWMHNRARMIVASFLVKDLLVDWRWGERFFMQHLVDGDPASNNGGWQWTAGTGTDAAPYFRIFNPVLQGRKYDPEGVYVRRWVPELTRVPQPYLHVPWEMPVDVQRQAGCTVGRDYPAPIVDHGWARERALAAYRAGRRPL